MLYALLIATAFAGESASTYHFESLHGALDCDRDPCADVLPGARRFEAVEGKPYQIGYGEDDHEEEGDDDDDVLGWVVRSTDVVDRDGYSGKPLVTLVGLGPDGRIAGARVIHHSEPILLLGIPDRALHEFTAQYVGRHATDAVQVGSEGVDAISGATVTVLAENATILESARAVGVDVGVVERVPVVPGHFVEDEPWSWARIVKKGALGHLVVTAEEMGLPADERPFVDLWFGLADAPQVGIPLLGERTWRWHVDRLADGEHLFVVFNGGTASFRGSGFVRGGIFDRIRVEQGLSSLMFTDHDYTRIDTPPVADAPRFAEAALFRAKGLDPAQRYDLIFLGSHITGAYARDFRPFAASHRVPRGIYALDGPDPDDAVWRAAWAAGWWKALLVGLYMSAVAGLFVARKWTTGRMKRLQRLHQVVLFTSFTGLGLWLHVQPSVTQLLTLAGTVRTGFGWRLFLSDPVLWVSWIGIAIVTVAWGRGVFCGWMCPYGAMSELAFKLGQRLGLRGRELPDAMHNKLRHLRYVVLVVLVAAFLWRPEVGEQLAEIEPFKSTFFVPVWTRHWGLIAWWSVLLGASFFTYRPFCRYVCPMGAALAAASSVRISGPHRRDFCSKCKICTRGCEPRAIRPDGTIDPRECLSCMECEANWRDEYVCPPLVKTRRDRERRPTGEVA